jgi:hypothetical protein
MRRAMSKRDSNWCIPADWLWHLGNLVMIACIGILSSTLLPVVVRLKTTDVATLYSVGVGVGFVGILLLFIARLPLYRQRKFWTVGPRELDQKHRRCYWSAYASVVLSLFLLWIVWLRIHES